MIEMALFGIKIRECRTFVNYAFLLVGSEFFCWGGCNNDILAYLEALGTGETWKQDAQLDGSKV